MACHPRPIRSLTCVAPRQRNALHLAEQVVEHVAPVAQHIHDDAAVVLLAVIPRGPLRLNAVVPGKYPVAELAAHAKDLAEEAGVDQRLQLHHARQPQLVLHDAVLDARLLRDLVQFVGRLGGDRRRLLAIDMLAGGDRLLDRIGAAAGGLRVEVDLCCPDRRAPRRGRSCN